jgi:putative sporulation protein YyaC
MSLLSPIKRTPANQVKIHIDDLDAINKFSSLFSEKLLRLNPFPNQPWVIMCIGTDRSTGDSLGPIVGTQLLEVNFYAFKVFGTLEKPVHATNLSDHLQTIESLYNPFIIAVDACLGNIDNVGNINIGEGALTPGAGVNKSLPSVGNLHITGVVNVGGFMEYFVLQNTRLSIVMKMAKIISTGIHLGAKQVLDSHLQKILATP